VVGFRGEDIGGVGAVCRDGSQIGAIGDEVSDGGESLTLVDEHLFCIRIRGAYPVGIKAGIVGVNCPRGC
jgi:hypothetical protein